MDLTRVFIFYLFVFFENSKAKYTRLSRFLPLEGRNITTAVIFTSKQNVAAACAKLCADLDSCQSFFFNSITGECQYHEELFISSDGATVEEGLQYYYIIRGRNDWCPLEKGFHLLAEYGPCVKFHTDRKTWYQANETCVSNSPDSRLVVVDDQEKDDLVKAAGMDINDQFISAIWIGLRNTEDGYRWVNGGEVDYTNWGSVDSNENCVWIGRNDGWRWRKMPCTGFGHYICEVHANIEQYHRMMP